MAYLNGKRISDYVIPLGTVDIATNDAHGVVKGMPDGEYGVMISANGEIQIRRATTDDINKRQHTSRPIVPANLKQAVTSVFEDVYSEVYVKTGKLEEHVRAVIADVMDSVQIVCSDGDYVTLDGNEILVSIENLEAVQGEFRGQLLYIRNDRSVYEVYMYLGLDVMCRNVWTKLGEVAD